MDTLTYDMTGTKLYYVNQYGVLERNGWFQFSGYEFDAGLGFSGQAGGYGYANADCSLMVNTNTYDWNGNLVYMQGDGTNYAFGENGKQIVALPLKEFKSGWNGMNGYIYEYDDSYNLIKKVYYEAGNIKSWSIYDYDTQGRLLEITDSDFDGVKQYTDYEYYSSGKESKKIRKEIYRSDKTEYSRDGKLYKIEDFNWVIVSIYTYYSTGQYMDIFQYNNGVLSSIEGRDINGKVIKDAEYDENGNLNYCDTYQYDYNTLGDLLCCTRYRDRGNGEVVEGQIQYEYRYDVYGNMLYYESHYWGHKIENEYVYR